MKQLFIALLLIFSINAFGQSREEVIDSLLYGQNGIESHHPNVGLVIGVYQNGKTSYYSFGKRTKGGEEPLDSATIFEIGSATKTFTALLLAMEIERGAMDQNDFIDSYLPKDVKLSRALKNKIKLTDLATHQSGLPNLSNDKYFADLLKKDPTNPFRFVDKPYLYSVLKNTDALKGYGQYQYNNYAFSLLGAILEEAKKKKYEALIKEAILTPLQMNSTSFEVPNTPNVAGLYNDDGEPQVYMIIDAANPAGGLKSNAVNLINYLKAHIASDKYKEAVKLTQQIYYKDKNRKMGLGWDIADDYFQKDGDTFGNSVLMRYSPARDMAIVVLSNHQNGQLVRDAVNYIYKGLSKD